MIKLTFIMINLFLFTQLLAGNEGGNGGHDHELNWEQNSQKIESALIHLKAAKEISGEFESDLELINSFMTSSSKDFKKVEIDKANKLVKIPEELFQKLNESEQFCETWNAISKDLKNLNSKEKLSCKYLQDISTIIYTGNWTVSISEMIDLCNQNSSKEKYSYVCSLDKKIAKYRADNLIEASKKAAVLMDKSICFDLLNANPSASLKAYTNLNQVGCFRE